MERTARLPAARAPVLGSKRQLARRSDAQLVALVRAGDDSAFEVLYDRYAAPLLGFCRHMLGSQQEAEDAVQQAFVSAHGALRRGSADVAFKPWLYTIARNRCVSMLRARREQPGELPEISTAGLNEQVERRAELRELVRDVQRLPEQQRAALLLSELEDLSHAEVAEVIDVTPRKVKALVFRARATLAERQEARGADCEEIRVELAAARGGGLRRGRLRYHIESCPACAAYLDELRTQRRLLGVALPVVPALALKESVMRELALGGAIAAGGIGAAAGGGAAGGGGAAAGAGGGGAAAGAGGAAGGAATGGGAVAAGAAGGAATAGGALLGGAAVKVAVGAALLVGGAGVATEVVRDEGQRRDGGTPPAGERSIDRARSGLGEPSGVPGVPAGRALERRGGVRGAERRALGQQRAAERSGGRSAAGKRGADARGRKRGPGAPGGGRALGRGRLERGEPAGSGGRALGRDGARTRSNGAAGRAADQAPRNGAGAGRSEVVPGAGGGGGSSGDGGRSAKPADPGKPADPAASAPPPAAKGTPADDALAE